MEGRKVLERKGWIDILKGILILFVIFGHTTTNSVVLNWLSSFYMPCFFILSGWLMKKEGDASLFIRKKIKGILFPYFCFALIWVLFCFVKNFILESEFDIFRALLSIILPYSGRIGGNAYNLWFLPCLFLSQALVAILIYEKWIWKIIASIVWFTFLILGIFVSPYCSLLYATAMASIFVGLGFYISNYLLPKIKEKSNIPLVASIILGGGVHISCLLLNEFILKNTLDFSAASFGLFPIYLLGALGGSIFFIAIISRIKKMVLLEYIGKNSLVYYALHYEVLAIVSFVASTLIDIDLLITAMTFILTLVLTTVVVRSYNKLNIGKLFK